MRLGERRITKEVCVEHVCEVCGESARHKLTFLLKNARYNPQSNAYGKDDCSWCSDDEMFVCDEHEKDRYKYAREKDMGWCSSFPRERFEHMFLYWQEIKK